MSLNTFAFLVVIILGLNIGSFLNVVILRLHTKKISRGRSKCMNCAHELSAKDIVPVFSFLFLRGRCRYCKTKMSRQYILVEITTAVMFLLVYIKLIGDINLLNLTNGLLFVYYTFVFSLLIVMSVYDMRHMILPWGLMRIFLVTVFLGSLATAYITTGITFTNVISGFLIAFPFWVLWYFTKGKAMGFGDIELMCGFGFMLGIASGIAAVMISFWAGALFVFLKMIISRKVLHGKVQIPFGPFLVFGAFLAFIFDITYSAFISGVF